MLPTVGACDTMRGYSTYILASKPRARRPVPVLLPRGTLDPRTKSEDDS